MMGPYWNVPYFKGNKSKSDKKCEWLDKSKVLINRDEEILAVLFEIIGYYLKIFYPKNKKEDIFGFFIWLIYTKISARHI